MKRPIERARNAWCDPYLVEFDVEGREVPIEYIPCPPEVVAALLTVLEKGCDCPGDPCEDYCNRTLAMKAITKALEQEQQS